MREQAIQKVGNRSGIGAKGRATSGRQQPVSRGRESASSLIGRLRVLAAYLPTVLKISLALAVVTLIFLGYRAAAAASFFQVRHIETSGTNRASTKSIEASIRKDVAETGVWRADLNEISTHLEQLPWVRTAIVTRVLPDGIRVRVAEREPRLVVRLAEGKFYWVDEDAVSLGEMSPADRTPAFFLRGWNEERTSTAVQENKERVKKFLELQREWEAAGVAERVSEVNLQDLGDVRAQLSGDDSQIEIRLGADNQAKRLKPALITLDKLRQGSRGPYISYLNVNQPGKILVGMISGAQALADAEGASIEGPNEPIVKSDSPRKSGAPAKPDQDRKDKTSKVHPDKKSDQKRG